MIHSGFKFIIFFCFISILQAHSQSLRIGLFNDITTNAVVFNTVKGSYLLNADNRAIMTFKTGQNIIMSKEGDSIQCNIIGKDLGKYSVVRFTAMDDSSVFSLRPVNPRTNIRYYDDNLELASILGKLQTINVIDIDKYLAGVVESEGGVKATEEYYKTQAVLCRTYALSHLDRHTDEGFFLCDGVHCQAYNGKCTGTESILSGAFTTRGLIVVDTDSILITAAFYSDCGGETESAQNVWLLNKSYLKPVQDPYCQNQRNYRWDKSMPLEKWKQYLTNNGFNLKPDASPSYFNCTQYTRKQYYKLGKDSVTFRKIRNDFKFKSAFFSIEVIDNTVQFHGRGYGHGVGLCQEGAMQMSKLGYNFREIIPFYYQGVNISQYTDVPVFKNSTLKIIGL